MSHRYLTCLFLGLISVCLFSQQNPVSPVDSTAAVPVSDGPSRAASQGDQKFNSWILNSFGALPLSFEANRGQTNARVKFLTRTGAYSLFLTEDEAVLAIPGKRVLSKEQESAPWGVSPVTLRRKRWPTIGLGPLGTDMHHSSSARNDAPKRVTSSVLRMKLRNANTHATMTGLDELSGTTNYFIGNDPTKWQTNVPTYAKVRYQGVYSGIDLVYYGNQRQLEYDFIVAPGADPRRIGFDVRGAKYIRRDADGDLVLNVGENEIRWHKPAVYQKGDGGRQMIAANYTITNKSWVGFEISKYDPSKALYIDPLIYSTYLGGSNFDGGRAIAVDNLGNAYVTGTTSSSNFPVTPGAYETTMSDLFVTKMNPSGSALVYSTYLGASEEVDSVRSIAVDVSGNAYITGNTTSSDFPVTPGAFQTSCGDDYCAVDAFVTKLNPTGSALVYSTHLGGGSYDYGEGIAVDSSGDAYVTGSTESADFPITPGAFQTTITSGSMGFVTKFNATGSALVYSTYLGGSQGLTGGDAAYGIAVDSSGNAYVTGITNSVDFPKTAGAYQSPCTGTGGCTPNAFVTKVNTTGSGLVFSSVLGGSDYDWGMSVAVDSQRNVYITGTTYSNDFPTTSGGFQTTCGGGGNNYSNCWDAFVTKISSDGSELAYSDYLGGVNDDWGIGITADASGDAYIIGYTESPNFPTKYSLQPSLILDLSAFITKVNAGGNLIYSTYLGGIGEFSFTYEGGLGVVEPTLGIAVDNSSNVYVTGQTSSYAFPTMKPLQPFLNGTSNAFVAKISAAPSAITLFPLHLDFRNQPVGVASGPQVAVLNNGASTSLKITSIGVTGSNSGDFAQTNDCGSSLAPGANCSITVTFAPTIIGNRSAAVQIVDSAPQQWISVTGLGLLDTTTKLSSSKNPSVVGNVINFKVVVSSPTGGTPTGNVYVNDGATRLASKLLKSGTMSFSTRLPLGLNALTVHYFGDSTYGYSDGSLNQYVLTASTTTSLSSLPSPSTYGQATTFTAIVVPSTGPPPPDGEMVSFLEGGKVLGTGALQNGSATFTTATLAATKNLVRAVYGGDSNLIGSTSNTVDQVVNKAATTMTLVSSQNPSGVQQPVTFSASVTPAYSGTVTGPVTFYDGTTKLASATLSGGTAKLTTPRLTAGSHAISATYGGNANFTGSSASLTQSVN